MTICDRCHQVDASAAWRRYWHDLEMPVDMPREVALPFCPSCVQNDEELRLLGNLTAVIVDLQAIISDHRPDVFEHVSQRIDARRIELLDLQRRSIGEDD